MSKKKTVATLITIMLFVSALYFVNQNSNEDTELVNDIIDGDESTTETPNIIIGGGGSGASTVSPTISPTTENESFNVYFDQSLTSVVENIDWGTLQPGDTTNVTVYIKNIYDTPLTLALTSTDVTPKKAENYLTLSLNYNSPITPNAICPLTLSLHVDENVEDDITDFSITFTLTVMS